MKTKLFPVGVAMLIGLLWAGNPAAAQAPGAGAGGRPVEIRRISGGKVPTPEYQLKKSQFAARTRDWFQIMVDYETDPEWVDEAIFTYYVVVKARTAQPGKSPYTLFKGDVTYINIEKGRHKSDIFIHPSTLARYGDVEQVAVLINVGGRLVAMDGLPQGSAAKRWWEQMSPLDGYLLNRMQTPFAMINFDDYEAVKPKP